MATTLRSNLGMERLEFAVGAGNAMTIPLLLLATIAWWIWQRKKADRESGLPGTFGLPFIGETLTYVAKMKTPLGNFVDLKAQK